MSGDALGRWREQLDELAIPDEIVARAPEPPWGFPTELFSRRASAAAEASRPTPTTTRALEALPEKGTVLDVGAGGGATSLPLVARARLIVGVDSQQDMLEAFSANAAAAGVEARIVLGSWPDVAPRVSSADVVVAGHVLYNTSHLEPFARALDRHANIRVVTELTDRHPLHWMSDLWLRFHGIDRPEGPTAIDAAAALRELGFDVSDEERPVDRDEGGGFARKESAVHLVRKRLCLTADRDREIEEALGDRLVQVGELWDLGPRSRTIVTLWWDVAA